MVATTTQAIYVFVCNPQATNYQYIVYSNYGSGWSQEVSFESEYEISSIATLQDQIYAIDPTGTSLLLFNQDQWTTVGTLTEGTMTTLLGSLQKTLWIAGKNASNDAIFIAAIIYLCLTFGISKLLGLLEKKMNLVSKPLPSSN
jgi:hypothetical protein